MTPLPTSSTIVTNNSSTTISATLAAAKAASGISVKTFVPGAPLSSHKGPAANGDSATPPPASAKSATDEEEEKTDAVATADTMTADSTEETSGVASKLPTATANTPQLRTFPQATMHAGVKRAMLSKIFLHLCIYSSARKVKFKTSRSTVN